MEKIKGFENYSITKEGEVYRTNFSKPRKISMCITSQGYVEVSLWKNNKRYKHTLHRLLAETFLENVNNHPLVRHLNDVKDDNRLENLAWGNKSQNMQDYFRNTGKTRIGGRTK